MTIRVIVLAIVFLVSISAGAQTGAFCVAAYDSNGIRVGSTDRLSLNGSEAIVFLENQGILVILEINRTVLSGRNTVLFTGADCTGDAYIEWTEVGELQPRATVVGTDLWHLDPTGDLEPFVFMESKRTRNDAAGACNNSLSFAPPTSSPALHLTLSFTPPFHLEPEPCFTPSPEVAALGPRSLLAMVMLLAFGAVLFMRRPR